MKIWPPVLTFGIWTRWIYLSVDLEKITLLLGIDPTTWHCNQFGHNEIWWLFSNSIYTVINCSQGLLQNPFTSFEILLPKNTSELAFWLKRFLGDLLKYHNNEIPDSLLTTWIFVVQRGRSAGWGRWHWDLWLNSSSFTHLLSDLEQIASSLSLIPLWNGIVGLLWELDEMVCRVFNVVCGMQ